MILRSVALAAVLTGLLSSPAQSAPPADQLYYTVTASYHGAPEDLWEVATRFLGDGGRAGEILDLNSGRLQPDGRRLADPSRLRAGGSCSCRGTRSAPSCATARCRRALRRRRPARPFPRPRWGQAMLTPAKAWPVADGKGVKVAVVGSGVDGAAAALAGRVSAGTDVAAGAGRGDIGCRGAGTALATIVAGTSGVAPEARIIPVKVGTGKPSPGLAATGIHVAAASGAEVVLVGADVEATNPEVQAAVSDAISRDVVVVLPASAAAAPADGLLRVGAVGEDRQPAGDAPAGTADLRAPGVTGAESAAAFVAGTVALVRSAHPALHAADVTRQVLSTVTDGLVSPVGAVTTALPAGVGVNAAPPTPSNGLGMLSRVLLWIAIALAVLLLLPFLLKRPAQMLKRFIARQGANRQAQQVRARMAKDGDDPFWEPPTTGPTDADRDEVTQASRQIR